MRKVLARATSIDDKIAFHAPLRLEKRVVRTGGSLGGFRRSGCKTTRLLESTISVRRAFPLGFATCLCPGEIPARFARGRIERGKGSDRSLLTLLGEYILGFRIRKKIFPPPFKNSHYVSEAGSEASR